MKITKQQLSRAKVHYLKDLINMLEWQSKSLLKQYRETEDRKSSLQTMLIDAESTDKIIGEEDD